MPIFQVNLLQQVMAATDADIEDEVLPGALSKSGSQRRNLKGFASMSGGDNDIYLETKKAKFRHPLFKKFKK